MYILVADSDIRNIRKCECQNFDGNYEKVDKIMHLVTKLSDYWLYHPGFFPCTTIGVI